MRTRTSPAGRSEPAAETVRAAAGFTLLEILVVLALIGVVSAVAAPLALRSLGGGSEMAAREIAAALRRARGEAIGGNREVAVTIDVAGKRYAVADGRPVALADGLTLALFTADSETVDDSAGRIRYFPDGSATGGEVTVGDAGRIWRVRVDWLTGRVVLLEGGRE